MVALSLPIPDVPHPSFKTITGSSYSSRKTEFNSKVYAKFDKLVTA